ncbi:MAG TPA: homoserine dehydrogenase [Thermomicrobiales bacterium]|nr:homoserine dehydrogenase [Thermomicrobiales bacterium]
MNEITLLGLGTVGSGVARACAGPGARWTVRRALVRDVGRARDVVLPSGTLTASADEALAGAGPVIEVLGGEEPAASLIAAALERGRPVATANKVAIAARGPRLFALARRHGVGLGIEACVGGGVPVIAALHQLAGGQRLTAVTGVVNGTTNAILGAMERGQSYAEALAAAQAAGFAEPDPSADVEGHDTAAKLAILAALAFGVYVDPAAIPRRPLADAGMADLRWAAARGARVKYIAAATLGADGALTLSVGPTAVPAADALAAPEGPGNAIRITGDLIGATTLSGPGAGAAPTAGALLGDLAALAAGALPLDYPEPDAPPAAVREPLATYAVRLPARADPDAIGHAARWSRDGDNLVGFIEGATASALAPAVRAAGGTLVRWAV